MAQKQKTGMSRFRDTAIAFDDLIVQVGRGLAHAQEAMDVSQIEFQRSVAKALAEGRMRQLDVNPANAYSIPETKLQLKVGMSMRYPEGGGAPSMSAVPLNAATANQNDVDVEAATEVNLRFVTVPQAKDIPGAEPSALTSEDVQILVNADGRLTALLAQLKQPPMRIEYAEQARIWRVTWLEAREPVLLALIDDRRGEITRIIFCNTLPTAEESKPIGPPQYIKVTPAIGKQGDVLTVEGDNFLTLAGQTILKIDGQPVPVIRAGMNSIAFKVPGWAIQGNVEVLTPLGSTGESGFASFNPVPTISYFDPKQGYYDAVRNRGSWLSIDGSNLREGCKIRFASGALSHHVKIISPGQMQVEVPAGAGSGPLTLVMDEHESVLAENFIMLPRISRISPRQARVGDEITIMGNTLDGITEVIVGNAIVPRSDFILQTTEQIHFLVPANAHDGRIRVREKMGSNEIAEAESRDIFYVVPRITDFSERVVSVGQLLTIEGEGLDPEEGMMTLLFDARGGISEAPVLSVTSDRSSLITRVPIDAVSGYVTLLRKRIYSDTSADTSNTAQNKLTVLTQVGHPSDLFYEERFDMDLSRWSIEAGKWFIDQGLLASEGVSRLAIALPEPRDTLAVYADVLNSERFGFAFTPADASSQLQVWVNLTGASPALTWSTLDSNGNQTSLDGIPLGILAGGNHLAQIKLSAGRISFCLDQIEVQAYDWGKTVTHMALLADSLVQRWDNVVVLKDDYLSLADPQFYRFGEIPHLPVLPPLSIDSFAPIKGAEGTEVTLIGAGLDDAASFFFAGVQAEVIEASGAMAKVRVPVGARSGPLEVHGRGGRIITSGEKGFLLPPKITGLISDPALVGDELRIVGINLPVSGDVFDVTVLGQPAQLINTSPTMVRVLVPNVSGAGIVSINYEGFTAQAPAPLQVNQETVLIDLLAQASDATWTTADGAVIFGALGESGKASVQLRESEHLEDDYNYAPVLFVHPPEPSVRALRGVYPIQNISEGQLELRLEMGMLWSAAPSAEDAAETDGVIFEVNFQPAESSEELSLLPRTVCVHDGLLEQYIIDASVLAGKRGQLIFSVYPGRNGLRDDAAVITAMLVQVS